MYAKYQTEALVLGSNSHGEADKVFSLYTRDFGLVHARASAVRREASRMRYALQNFSRSHTALVRGTRGWRVAGARSQSTLTGEGVGAGPAFARISQLIERLVAGEEQNERLFSTLADAHEALRATPQAWATIELICVARILHALGYLSVEALGSALFVDTAYHQRDLEVAENNRSRLLQSVNYALSETQL